MKISLTAEQARWLRLVLNAVDVDIALAQIGNREFSRAEVFFIELEEKLNAVQPK